MNFNEMQKTALTYLMSHPQHTYYDLALPSAWVSVTSEEHDQCIIDKVITQWRTCWSLKDCNEARDL